MNAKERRKQRRRLNQLAPTETDKLRIRLRRRIRETTNDRHPAMRRHRGRISANARRDYRERLSWWLNRDQANREWVDSMKPKQLTQLLKDYAPRGRAVPKSTTLARMMAPKPPLDPSRVG